MQERISSILKKAQYRVECIQEEDKAILQIKESQPDLILLAPAGQHRPNVKSFPNYGIKSPPYDTYHFYLFYKR